MTRMVCSLVLLLSLALTTVADDFRSNTTDDDHLMSLFPCQFNNLNSPRSKVVLQQTAIRQATFRPGGWCAELLNPVNGCLFIDEILETSSIPVTAKADVNLWAIAKNNISPSLQSAKPLEVDLLIAIYKGLTWNGDAAPHPAIVKANQGELGVTGFFAFDIERALVESQHQLSGLPANYSPAAPASEMDDYWTYFTDCDRWNVVFADAVQGCPVGTGENGSEPSWWEQLEGIVDRIPEMVEPLGEPVAEFIALYEFYRIETAEPVKYRVPLVEWDSVTEWMISTVKPGEWLRSAYSEWECWMASDSDDVWRVALNKLATDHAEICLEQEKKMVRAYFAPRLNWLSQQLGDAAQRMDDSVDIAREKTNIK